jgi:MFS family permease
MSSRTIDTRPELANVVPVSDDIPHEPRRWLTFAVLVCGTFLTPVDYFIVNVALPSIREGLGADSTMLQLVISSYAATYAVMLITGGRLGDLFGRIRMFVIGLLGFGLASFICGLAPTPAFLITGRTLQGLTAAILAPQCLATVSALFRNEERPRVLSIYGATFGLGAVAGQALGGVLINLDLFGLGWRIIFLVNLPIIALILIFGLPLLKETRAAGKPDIDYGGVLLLSLTLALLIVPLVEGREAGWPLWSIMMLILSPGAAALFLRKERREVERGRTPIVDVTAFSTPGLRSGIAATLFFYSNSALLLLISVYLENALGKSPLAVGLACLPFGFGFLLGPLTTPYVNSLFKQRLIGIGLGIEVIGALMLAGIVAYAPAASGPEPTLLTAVLFLNGFGQGVAMPVLVREVTGRFHNRLAGLASGVVSSSLQISSALSVAVIGGVFYIELGNATTPDRIAYAFSVAMACVAIGLAVAALLSLGMQNAKR